MQVRCDDSLPTKDKRVIFYPKHLAKEIDDLNDWPVYYYTYGEQWVHRIPEIV